MAMIDNDWLEYIQDEFRKPYYKELYQFVRQEYNTPSHLEVLYRYFAVMAVFPSDPEEQKNIVHVPDAHRDKDPAPISAP